MMSHANAQMFDYSDQEFVGNVQAEIMKFPQLPLKQSFFEKVGRVSIWTVVLLLFYAVAFGLWTITGAVVW